MRQAKTQKRLVTKAKYVRVLGKKITLYSVGIVSLLVGVIGLQRVFLPVLQGNKGCIHFPMTTRLISLILGVGQSCGFYWISKSLFDRSKAIEPVAPITRHNTEMLPVEESLVRASTEPPINQQAQLLRAAQGGQETPQEQLLRSAQE